jgi:kynureninase
MNSLTSNLHFLMQFFYRPKGKRFKIMVEDKLFPSDFIACKTLLEQFGHRTEDALIILKPRSDAWILKTEEILESIEREKDELALVLIGGVQYLTGQFFEIDKISEKIQQVSKHGEIIFGVDLAHAVGNVPLKLHQWSIDFACWCSYKYLNSGPGGIGGAFIHEKHLNSLTEDKKRAGFLGGWWSQRLSDRFEMKLEFTPEPSALNFQVSNPPILLLAALNSSLSIFHEAGMDNLRRKSISLTRYLEILLQHELKEEIEIITPGFDRYLERGAMLCLRFKNISKVLPAVFETMEQEGVIADLRKPDIIRVAPCPLYNSFRDVYEFVQILKYAIQSQQAKSNL